MIPPFIDEDSSSGQHCAKRNREHFAGRENVLQFTHLLQTQIYFFYEFFDRDEDVLCLAGASKATNQTIKLLRDTTGDFYFGREGAFGLCRYQSLQMVATSCRLQKKNEFVDHCRACTSRRVEFIVTSVQRACFLAGAPRKYVFVTINERRRLRDQHCIIPSLSLKICLLPHFNDCSMRTWFEDMYSIYDDEEPELRQYRGLAFPAACSCEPLLIPSQCQIEAHHLQAIHHSPTFLIVIWKNESTAVTPVEYWHDLCLPG